MNMKTLLSAVAAVLGAATAFGGARVSVETRTIKTYPFSDPDPTPATAERRYPYFRYDRTSADAVERDWRMVVLENEKTRVMVLPEVGGKVWAATDKTTGNDFLYCNHVLKFRDIAVRGPWVSGGIEFNFGTIGHAPSSSTPVDWFTCTNADGSASCFVSSREFATRTVWQVEIRLGADAADFETRTTWFNGSGVPEPLYHWMNAAYSVRDNPEFKFTGETVIGHAGEISTVRWPLDAEGREISVYTNNCFGGPKSYHVLPGNNGFYAVWWPGRGFGSYHRSASYEKYGRKIWLWSLAREGGIWEDLLTDTDGQYAELQSGLVFNQPQEQSSLTPFKQPTFAPGATMAFTESWGPVHDLREISHDLETRSPTPRPITAPDDFDWDSAWGHAVRGEQYLRQRRDAEGAAEFRAALALDAHLSPALTGLAGYELRRGGYAAVHALCERALAVDAYDPAANYLDGFAAFAEGDVETSRERLGLAALRPEYRSAAYATIARGYLRDGRKAEALAAAEKALAANDANRDALLAKLIALRGGPAAVAFANEVLARFPLMHAARYELRLNGGEWKFDRFVAGELPAEEFKEIGWWYAETGLDKDARQLFARAGDDVMAKLALGDLDAVKRAPLAGVAPFRREEVAPLERAVARDPHWKFRYLLAVLKAYFGNDEKACEFLDACGEEPNEAVFYTYRASRRTGAARLADLRRAAVLGDSWRVGRALAAHFADDEDWESVLATTTDYLARFPGVNPLELAHARALNACGRYRETLAFLEGVNILPSETRDSATAFWHEAQDALGLRRSWPEKLGRGKPFSDPSEMTVGIESSMVAVFPRAPYKKPVVDASEAKVRLARGEYESFQVVVTCPERDLENVRVSVGTLRFAETPWYAPWRALRTFPAERVACEMVGYAWTTFPTNETKFSKSFSVCEKISAPPGYRRVTETAKDAWWPDPILDFLDGVKIAKGDVQSFWVRLHCPDDQPAGIYRGTITVSADGVDDVELSLVVRVNDFAVPKVSPLPLAITYMPMCYGVKGDAADAEWAKRQEAKPDGPVALAKTCPEKWGEFLADYYITFDSLYTRERLDFAVLMRLKRQGRLGRFNLGYWDYFKDGPDAEAKWRAETLPRIRANYDQARNLGILDHAYIYGCDEVDTNYFDNIRRSVAILKKEFPGVPISTTAYDHDYGVGTPLEAIDWFTPLTPKYDREKAAKARAAGHQVWWYICCGPGNPWANTFTQCPPMESRLLMGAQSVKMRPDGFLYYEVSLWNADRPITSGPFTDWVTRTYKTLSGDGCWTAVGEGGRPLPTLRLENFRDGLEDYAYAQLLAAKAARFNTEAGVGLGGAQEGGESALHVSGRAASAALQASASPSETNTAQPTNSLPVSKRAASAAWLKKARELLAVPASVMESMTNYTDDPAALAAWRDAMADLIEAAE